MKKETFNKTQLFGIAAVLLFIWTNLIWMHFHGGVPSHHIMHRKDLPSISSWWGGLLLPLLAWITFYRIRRRLNKQILDEATLKKAIRNIVIGFLGAMLFGIMISVAFNFEYTNFINYQVDSLLILFFLMPMFRSEYLLGFIIGMTITFGVILPTAFALIVAAISAIVYNFIRPLFLRLIEIIRRKPRQNI